MTIYPLKFNPILKERIWGGDKLKSVLNKETALQNVGESWEVSDVDGDASIVANGPLKGMSLKELQMALKADLIGEKNYRIFRDQFPLLIKFIDAKQDLSVQLHPNDELAAKRHNSFGKTEMWYVMQADANAKLIVDFNQPMNRETYRHHLNNKTLPEVLNFESVKAGDAFFIEVGRVHAIGAGVLLAEIQQTSDITYRLYDWDRVDANGNSRKLHIDLALDAIDFDMPDNFKVDYNKTPNQTNSLVSCPYFTTNYLDLTQPIDRANPYDSFLIYMCVEGTATFKADTFSETISIGETLLIPAAIKQFKINTDTCKLLEVYV